MSYRLSSHLRNQRPGASPKLPRTSHYHPPCPKPTQPQPWAGLVSCDGFSHRPSERSRLFSQCPLLSVQDMLPAVAMRADFQLHIRNGEFMSFPRLPVHPLHKKSQHQEEATWEEEGVQRNASLTGKPLPLCLGERKRSISGDWGPYRSRAGGRNRRPLLGI